MMLKWILVLMVSSGVFGIASANPDPASYNTNSQNTSQNPYASPASSGATQQNTQSSSTTNNSNALKIKALFDHTHYDDLMQLENGQPLTLAEGNGR